MANNFSTIPVPNFEPNDLKRVAILTGVPSSIAAAGSVQGDATSVDSEFVSVTAADGTKGVILPADAAGRARTVYNSGTLGLKVYPPSGASIDGGSANAAVTLPAKATRTFIFVSATVVVSLTSAVETSQAQTEVDALELSAIRTAEVTFTETSGAGTYTGTVALPAGATVVDIIVHAVALWDNAGAVTMKVGDMDDDGFYTGIDLKATDLLAAESLAFAKAGGKEGVYITATHVTNRYASGTRNISGIITSAGAGGSAGRTRMTVIYSVPTATAATKA